ncbi:putative ER degradation-enhancing alpha-mannosidase-like protein 1 [Glarea lozoyensis 74030]|uniref:alpha-1,2-Mannosidase n=1 Tax=Glarea lozoyensis (strain ATCC 74030 / MF5533) TaxID=1104152 RepID=H0EYU8_GLAL7|nr:putative ER degradation-enhancing alpha-mannosidase-like protein 1 [Glarea lozoyensis 74030]
MSVAFPEDEVRNYQSIYHENQRGAKALRDFQDGVVALVEQYGDGRAGSSGKGLRGRGFDVDSKVQVFETVIRGVGGLLSAHLFAIGELPIDGYTPKLARTFKKKKLQKGEVPAISWPGGFRYDGQLLRLALDLAQRLLPAFYTTTGMPYPRVNLRYGIPFYLNSPLNRGSGSDTEEFTMDENPEITETCSAGAGSLVLEFTVLSRLTNDPRFEQLAKRAFWAVWDRRSSIGLLGAGVDAENGQWIGPYSGIGAGIDSFFEYALKTHILLPLTEAENSPETFLAAWHEAHAAIKRHLYSGIHHPHYVNVHLSTGSPQAYWIDSLGAYYPGLLALAGEVEEAIETNLLYTALWTRYAALPERWSVRDGHVEGGLGWWPGRPEFIESNYHLYRATRDPWYFYVGEMVLSDIKARCWTECGWAGLQDVRTGEKSDRMESFFLGETAKYLYLLFDPDHPLNRLDAPYVFTTEGHPLIIPKAKSPVVRRKAPATRSIQVLQNSELRDTCPSSPSALPFSISVTAARPNMALGRDEQVFIPRDVMGDMNDPSFTRVRDVVMLDVIIQLENDAPQENTAAPTGSSEELYDNDDDDDYDDYEEEEMSNRKTRRDSSSVSSKKTHDSPSQSQYKTMLSSLFRHVTSVLRDPAATLVPQPKPQPTLYPFTKLPAIAPTGLGAAGVIDVPDAPDSSIGPQTAPLIWKTIFFAGQACSGKLPDSAPRNHEVIIIRRGGCTFHDKLSNIPAFTPIFASLKLVIIIDHEKASEEDGFPEGAGSGLFRPLIDKRQVTPKGVLRRDAISMVMVSGGDETEAVFRRCRSVGIRRRYHVESQGKVVGNVHVI